ncbi:MAG: Uma2 family endonuclease [Runella sp.]
MEKIELHQLRFSDDEFYSFCRQNDTLKFEREANGTIIVMPNTGGKTGKRNLKITMRLGIWNEKTQLGEAFDSSTAFRLPSTAVRSPDAAWIVRERWESLTEKEKEQFPPLCPDFVVELMSATDDLQIAKNKMTNEWIANGCRLAWLINPQEETNYIYRSNGEIQIVKGFDKTLSGEDVLPGFTLELKELR